MVASAAILDTRFEKTALNMSIRRVIFTSGQTVKRPNDFFLTLEISFGSLIKPKNRNLKKIAVLKTEGILSRLKMYTKNQAKPLTW